MQMVEAIRNDTKLPSESDRLAAVRPTDRSLKIEGDYLWRRLQDGQNQTYVQHALDQDWKNLSRADFLKITQEMESASGHKLRVRQNEYGLPKVVWTQDGHELFSAHTPGKKEPLLPNRFELTKLKNMDGTSLVSTDQIRHTSFLASGFSPTPEERDQLNKFMRETYGDNKHAPRFRDYLMASVHDPGKRAQLKNYFDKEDDQLKKLAHFSVANATDSLPAHDGDGASRFATRFGIPEATGALQRSKPNIHPGERYDTISPQVRAAATRMAFDYWDRHLNAEAMQ